jgi:putative phage-type endonuclease
MNAMHFIKELLVRFPEMEEEEWKAERRKHIGATDISILLGVNPWRTTAQLYYDKVEGSELKPNISMRRGQYLEPLVADIYSEQTVIDLGRRLFIHPQYDLFAGTPDKLVITPDDKIAILEIKTAVSYGCEKFRNGVPPLYMAQLYQYIWIVDALLKEMGYKYEIWGDLAALLDDKYECWSGFQYDKETIGYIHKAGTQFYTDHWLPNIVPLPESMEDIKLVYREVVMGSWIECTDEFYDLLLSRKFLRDSIKNVSAPVNELKEKLEQVELAIRKFMGANEVVIKDNDEIATCKADKNGVRRLYIKEKFVLDSGEF